MATNPMQRKANNYLLVGVLVTLLITGSIIAFLFMQLNTLQQENKKREKSMKDTYIASTDIKSGENITIDKLKKVSVPSTIVPENALSISNITEKTIARIDLKVGTIINENMVTETDQVTTSDLRKQEYNMIVLPSQLENGSYVDIRLMLSTGVDFIVASKKQITIPEIDGVPSANTIQVNMTEAETMVMTNAIIEAYIDHGSMLYVTTYIEPGMQTSLTPTYVPTDTVRRLISNNPNIAVEARNALVARYSQENNLAIRSQIINPTLSQYEQNRVDNIEEGVQQQITKAKEQRELYLQSLGGY